MRKTFICKSLFKKILFAFLIFTFPLFLFTYAYSADWTVSSDSTLAPGTYTFDTLTINPAITLTCKGDTFTNTGVTINCQNLIISVTSKLNADSQGYYCNLGTGNPGNKFSVYASGGSYGGYGDDCLYRGPTYGSIKDPTGLGSSGRQHDSWYNNGGGYLILNVSNMLQVDGTLSANGYKGAGNNSGGSGGTIRINANVFTGSGQITANGGTSENVWGGNGGGGRIAIYYQLNSFTGTILARRGINGEDMTYFDFGGCGTIFMKSSYQTNGDLIIDGGGYRSDSYNYTPVPAGETFDTVTIKNYGYMALCGDTLTTYYNLKIENNGILAHNINDSQQTHVLNLEIRNNLTIDSGASIDVTYRGYKASYGPGAGAGSYGGSYGGKGYGNSGDVYGSDTAPVHLGSGGDNTSGGGAVRIQVYETLRVDGNIYAKGGNSSSGGAGSGGSVYLRAPVFTGISNAKISVKGGSSTVSANGGGGRIAIYYYSSSYQGTYDTTSGGTDTSSTAGSLLLQYYEFGKAPRNTVVFSPSYVGPITGKRPAFMWTATTDQENDNLHFDVQINQDSTFVSSPALTASSDNSTSGFQYSADSGVAWQDFSSSGISSNANPALMARYTCQQDLTTGNWYWRVRAKDNDGNAEWSLTGVLPSIIDDLYVRINTPDDSSATYAEKIKVEGTIQQSASQYYAVNGETQTLTLTDNQFSFEPDMQIGENRISVTAIGQLSDYITDTVVVYRLRIPVTEQEGQIGKEGGTVRLEDWDNDSENDARVEIPKNIFSKETKVSIKKLGDDFPVYEIKADGKGTYRFSGKIKIALSYYGMKVDSKDEDKLRVFHSDGVRWNPIGSEINKNKKTVVCYTNHLSKYAVMILPSEKYEVVKLSTPVVTPNGDGINDMAVFNIMPKENGKLEIRIYDIDGKILKIITEESVDAGMSVGWEGNDAGGKLLESGLYIYSVSIAGKTVNSGTVMIAK